jgi:hypothetical protein
VAGLLGYSYASLATDASRPEALAAFVRPSSLAPEPPFAVPAAAPATPWKFKPTTGHLKGLVVRTTDGRAIDGAEVRICGPEDRTLATDATGFFGAVDLKPGDYRIVVSAPGFEGAAADVTVRGAGVAHLDFPLEGADPANPGNVRASAGGRSAVVSWTTPHPSTGWVELRANQGCDLLQQVEVPQVSTNHTVCLGGLDPSSTYRFEITAAAVNGGRERRSGPHLLRTAGDILVDNPDARFTGGWSLIRGGTGMYGADFRQATAVGIASTPSVATWEADLPTPGFYAVEAWFPGGTGRSRAAPFEIVDSKGTRIVAVDQAAPGGGWRTIQDEAFYADRSPRPVRLKNNTGETGRTFAADALRWRYLEEQDQPRPDDLPAWWRLHFFGTSEVPAVDDTDADGMSNAQEHLAATDPTDRASALLVTLAPLAAGGWRVGFRPRLTGRSYRLETRAPSFVAWHPLSVPAVDDGHGGGFFVLPGPGGDEGDRSGVEAPAGLFRVAVAWPP